MQVGALCAVVHSSRAAIRVEGGGRRVNLLAQSAYRRQSLIEGWNFCSCEGGTLTTPSPARPRCCLAFHTASFVITHKNPRRRTASGTTIPHRPSALPYRCRTARYRSRTPTYRPASTAGGSCRTRRRARRGPAQVTRVTGETPPGSGSRRRGTGLLGRPRAATPGTCTPYTADANGKLATHRPSDLVRATAWSRRDSVVAAADRC